MSAPIDMKIRPDQLAAMSRVIREMQDNSGKEPKRIVVESSMDFCRSARKRTPLSQLKRDIFPNPDYRRRGGTFSGSRYLIQSMHQPHAISLFGTNQRSDPRRVIARRGAAKGAWNGVIRALGRGTLSGGGSGESFGRRFGSARVGTGNALCEATLTNRTVYFEELDRANGIVSEAWDAAVRTAEYKLNRMAVDAAAFWNRPV